MSVSTEMRVVGIDYGERRLGIAVSDPGGTIAMPFRVLDVRGDDDAVAQVRELCGDLSAERIVVGLPLNMDGSRGPMAERVERFIEQLSGEFDIPVETTDERLSTRLVERVLLDADMSRKRRKGVRDKLAAQVILQGYLDREAGPLDCDREQIR